MSTVQEAIFKYGPSLAVKGVSTVIAGVGLTWGANMLGCTEIEVDLYHSREINS